MPTLRSVVTLLSAGLLLACSGEPTDKHLLAPPLRLSEIPDNAAGPSASGQAIVLQQPTGALRNFAFHARRMPDGTVAGEYENHNRQGAATNHGDVDCLRFVGTNVAVMSGTITRHTNPLLEGGRSIFTVQDNGEGSGAAPDKVSVLWLFPAGSTVDCQTFAPLANLPLIGGNIRVDP
ncbi:MAG TPA: hypothetical protein VFS56_00750 [Gemmatimonadaceae bacterium]|nr:hypothetical protein [Gemmatimonadaceae bacterium]